MIRLFKGSLAFLLACIFIITSCLPVFATGGEVSYSSEYNSGKRDETCVSLDGTGALDYYGETYDCYDLIELSPDELLESLNTLMTDTHTTLSSYNDCHYKADRTDCQNGDGSVLLLYSSYSSSMDSWAGNMGKGWNREHVWPKSLGGNTEKGGGADLHHIRPADYSANSSRGNKPYNNVENPTGTTKTGSGSGNVLAGHSDRTYFEPLDNVKGDVARICLYMYVRWGAEWGADDITKVFYSVDVLLEWCEIDPVDTWEMGRNEVVEDIQGNRNVFIDYPELAWVLFDRDIPADMTTPSGIAEEVGAEICQHRTTEIKNAEDATCFEDGYTGDVYCAACNKKMSDGSAVAATNAHTWGEWTSSASGAEVRRCTVCNAEQGISVEALLSGIDDDARKITILLALGISDSAILGAIAKE